MIEKADFPVSAQCFRVNVIDGHTVSVRVNLKETATLEEVVEAMRTFLRSICIRHPRNSSRSPTSHRGRSHDSTATTATE